MFKYSFKKLSKRLSIFKSLSKIGLFKMFKLIIRLELNQINWQTAKFFKNKYLQKTKFHIDNSEFHNNKVRFHINNNEIHNNNIRFHINKMTFCINKIRFHINKIKFNINKIRFHINKIRLSINKLTYHTYKTISTHLIT